MAPVGTVIPGRRSTAPTVPRVGRTGMAAPVGRPGGSTRQSSPAVPWRDDRSPSGHGAHPGAPWRQGFYWPGMQADVSRICNECDCTMLKKRRGRREPLHQYIVGAPMERLAMDVAGLYPVTSTGNQYCLIVGCYFSKWLECFPIPDQKATTVSRKLVYEIVARYGAFRELHSDQGTDFGSKVVLEVCRLFGIHKTRTTPYHPRSDGFIERSFRTLGQCLKAACRETKQEWDELVPLILMSYRATPQASTGVTPNMMMLGRQTRLPVQAMYGAPLGPEGEKKHGERVRDRTPGRIASSVPARPCGVATGSVASKT